MLIQMVLLGIALYLTAGIALLLYENSHEETALNDGWDSFLCAVLWPLWLYAIAEDAARDWQMRRRERDVYRKKTHGE